jgi:putative membrane protein
MRFKNTDVQALVMLGAATYVTYLGLTDQLNLYIHPRYIVFTVVMAVIGVVVALFAAYYPAKKDDHKHKSSILKLLPLMLVMVTAIVLPARTLTSATVSQRSIDSGSLVTTAESRPLNTLFQGSSKGLRIADWSRLLVTNTDPAYYVNKPAKVSGFVYDAGLGDNTVWLARFVLTCCAVDAQPVGVAVQLDGWRGQYSQDEWLEVEGEFRLAETADGQQFVIIPDSVRSIERPSNPYAN